MFSESYKKEKQKNRLNDIIGKIGSDLILEGQILVPIDAPHECQFGITLFIIFEDVEDDQHTEKTCHQKTVNFIEKKGVIGRHTIGRLQIHG
jgi:hypothetical protein